MNSHKRVHKGESKFQCNICKKNSFKVWILLEIHKSVETGENYWKLTFTCMNPFMSIHLMKQLENFSYKCYIETDYHMYELFHVFSDEAKV